MSLQISNLQIQAGTPEQISFQVTGPAGTNDSVLIQFKLNGVSNAATAVAGSGSVNPVPVAGAAAAQGYVFSWDALTDLGTPRPAVVISASLVSDPTVVVTVPFPAPPSVTQLAVTPGEPPTLDFVLSYAVSSPCTLEVQFSANGGPWLAATAAGTPPATWPSSPTGQPGSYSWNAMQDLSPQPTTAGVQVRATANGDVGEWATITGLPFIAVVNTPPVIVYADYYFDAVGTNIRYKLSDQASQPCSVLLEFSVVTVPPSTTPIWASLLPLGGVQPTGVATTPAGTQNVFAWDTRTQFGNVRPYPTVQVRLTPSNPYLKGVAYTIPYAFIPNSRVQALNVTGGSGSPIPIKYTLEDVESDPTAITCLFSIDDAQTWRAATAAPGTQTMGLTTSRTGVPQIFEWDALTDLANQVHPMVIFQISPYDVAPGIAGSSQPFLVNFAPTCAMISVTPGDPTFIEYQIQDHEADVCSVAVEYSLDGVTWKPATESKPSGATSQLLSAPPGNQHTFSWNARNDLGSNDVKNVRVSVIPADLQTGIAAISNPFEIDLTAHTPPALTAAAVAPGAYRAYTIISFNVADADASPAFLELEYSLDGGHNWRLATVAAPSLAAAVATSPAGTPYSLQWDSWADLGEVLANGVTVQVAGRDPYGRGSVVSSAFNVDARPAQPPAIQNLTANPVASVGPVIVSFDLLEPEGRDCSVAAEFSLDSGATWKAATPYSASPLPALNSLPASPTGVPHYFAWDVLTDLQAATSAILHLTPSTTRPGASVPLNFALSSLPATQAPPPSISPAATATQAGPGQPVLISFTATDPSCRAIEVTVQYVDSAGNANYCTDLGQSTGGSLSDLVGLPAGVPAVFAWDCGTDLNGATGNYSFLLTPQSFGEMGAVVPVAAIAVSGSAIQPQPPSIVNPQVQPADRDGTVALRFGLSQVASDACDITAQWLNPATSAWKAATLAAPFTQLASGPGGTPAQIVWNGVADAGAGSFVGLQLSLTANNGQASGARPTPAFNARFLPPHPRALAAVGMSIISMNQREPVSLSVNLNDPFTEYATMSLRYNVLGAADWHAATIAQNLPMSTLPNGESRGLLWDASSDLPNGTFAQIRLEATPFDSTGRPGPAVRCNPFALEVWPNEAQPPVASNIQLIPGAAGDPAVIQATVADLESLMCDLTPEYTLDDGSSWNQATLVDATTARGLATSPQGATLSLNWDVNTDLPNGNYPSVRARVTPQNGWAGAGAVSPPIALVVASATRAAPVVANLAAVGAANDEFQFSMNLVHPRSAPAKLEVLFSTDNGSTWQTATAADGVDTYPPGGFDTAPAPGAPLNWWWDLETDLGPGASLSAGAVLQVVATAEGLAGSANLATGPLTTSAALSGNPTLMGAPLVDPSTPDQVGIVVVVADPNSVAANVTLTFSTDGGTTWKSATGVTAADTTGLATNPMGQESIITWATRRDLTAQPWPNVLVQVACGTSNQTSASFAIDLSGPLSVAPAIAPPTAADWAPGLIAINFVLTDDRSISDALTVAFTCQEKPGWTPATEAVNSGSEKYRWTSNSSGIEHSWYWAALRDLGVGTWHNIQVQMTVSDGSQQAQATVTIGDRTFTAVPAMTSQLVDVVLENRDDSVRRRVACSLNCTPPGPVDLQYLLITPTATVPASVIGAPDQTFASDPVTLPLYWNANADVTAALDNQPLTLRVEASSGGAVIATADLTATTDITDRSALPTISAELQTSAAGEVSAPVCIDFWISDPLADPDDLLVEFSRDGGATWLEATAWPGEGEGRQAYETSDGQTGGLFVWDIESDIPERYATGLQARVRLRSTPGILPGVTGSFDIDLGAPDGHTPTSFLAAPDGSGPVVPIDVELYDRDGDLVNLVLEFFSPLSGTWVTATAADGSDLFDASPAQPEGTQYRYLWDAQADASQIFPPGMPPAGQVQMRATVRKARAASLADTHTFSVNIDASPYDTGLRDYPNIRPGTLTVTGGIPQTAIGGQLLATPITLQLMDQTGKPIANAEVQLLVNPGSAIGAEIVPVSVFTDGTGSANAQVRPADGTSGQLTLMAQVVGAPDCRLSAPVSITVDASTVVLQGQPLSFVVGNVQPVTFQFGSSDPNAGMSIAYGRPVQLVVTTDTGRISARQIQITEAIFPPGALPTFSVDVVAQTVGNITITVAYLGATTTLFSQSFPVTASPAATRTTGDTTTANAQVALVSVSGDDPTNHADGTRWPAAGSEQWCWPGLTLTTPFQVKLLIDGLGDGPSPAPPPISGPNVTGPPPDPPAPQPAPTTSCAGVTIGVTSVGSLNEATATTRLQVSWTAIGGTLSTAPTHSSSDPSSLPVDICAGVYFTPTTTGPYSITASLSGLVLDPGRQYWIHTYTDSTGTLQTEIHRGDALSVNVQWVFEIQPAPVYLVYNDANNTQADRISAGVTELVLARVSPSTGTSSQNVAISAVQSDGSAAPNYTGPNAPPAFSNPSVPMTLQSSGTQLQSASFLFVRGLPASVTPAMLSFLRAAWVQVTALGPPLVLPTDPPLRARLPLNGRPSVQDAVAGTTPFAGWLGTVSLSDCELVYPTGVLEIVTAFGGMSLFRTWRGHLTWERRTWMNDDESRVLQWAGAFGPGWIGSFETELVPTPTDYRFMDASGRVMRLPGGVPTNGLIASVVTNTVIDPDHAPMHLTFPNHGELRFHADGTLREMVDARGHKTTFAYDQNSLLTSITDPHGHTVTFSPAAAPNTRRAGTISDANQRAVTFQYQTSGALTVQGMLDNSSGPPALSSYGGSQQSFVESYMYLGATAATATLSPYAQVTLQEVFRGGESKVNIQHSAGGVHTQTWNGGTVTFTPGTGTTRYLLVVFRDSSQKRLTFGGGGADAAGPTMIQEYNSAAGLLRTSNYYYNSQARLVRAELPDSLVHRWTFDDGNSNIFCQGNLLAHEMAHTVAPAPPPPGSTAPAGAPVAYSRVESREYSDTQNPASATAAIPPESNARRTQRTWRTDVSYTQFGEVAEVAGPSARSTRIALNGELFGPSPAPYTLDHKLDRPTVVTQYNNDGLVTSVQHPDGIVTQYAYFALNSFNSGTYSADGAGLLAQEVRDAVDNPDRQFWYLGQPPASRQTLWIYDAYGHLTSTTDSRGCRHSIAANELGLPLRVETGIAPAGMPGTSVVHRTEYDAQWRPYKRILEQPGGTAEQGGTELDEVVTNYDNEDREISVTSTISASATALTNVRRGIVGLVDGVCRPCLSTAQPKEILSVIQREDRGLPVSTSLAFGRTSQTLPVSQAWDVHGAPSSVAVQGTTVQTYRGGAFGTIGGNTDPRVGLTNDLMIGTDASGRRSRLTSTAPMAARQQKRPAGTYGFGEERSNEWGLLRRVNRARNARPGSGSGAPLGSVPDPPVDGVPGADPNFTGRVAVDKNDSGFGPGDGRASEEIEYDILGRASLYQNDRTNTMQTCFSPDGVKLRERIGERDQLAWNNPLVPWRDQQWRWQPGTDWTFEVLRQIDAIGDPTQETTTLKAGTVGEQRKFVNTYAFDSFGRVAAVTDPLGGTIRYTYDVHGEIATVTDANGALASTGTTNVDGNKTAWIRDGLGRVVRIQMDLWQGGIAGPSAVSAGSIQRTFSYTPEGQIATVTDAGNFVTTWNYSPNGQLESVVTPKPRAFGPSETVKQSIAYDNFGRPSMRTLASGATRTMNYNAAKQLERIDIKQGTVKGTLSYAYHPLGPIRSSQLVWVGKDLTPAGAQTFREVRTVEYDIDSNGRLNGEKQFGARRNLDTGAGQTVEHEIQYTYDGDGLRTGLVYSDQQAFRVDLDRTGRILGVIRGKEEKILRYEMLGEDFVRARRSGVVSEIRDMDGAGRLSSIQVSVNSNTLVQHTITARDRCGRITGWTRTTIVASGQVTDTRSFAYDSAGRVVQETAIYQTVGTRTVTRQYDGDSTLVREQRTDTPVSGAATTRAKLSIRGGGGAIFETNLNVNGTSSLVKTFYDADGNVWDNGRILMQHDALGRLVYAVAANGQTRYAYDGNGRLVACVRLDQNCNETFREDFVWDDWRLTEVWRDGQLRERFVYGRGLNEIVRAEINGVAWFPVYGPDGSVDCILNDLGYVVESYAYDLDGVITVFDDQRNPVSRMPIFRFGFHGHLYDPVNRLVYMRERWYSPDLAQFLESDPEPPTRSPNLYALCGGDTVNQWDPYGRIFFLIPLLVVMAIGAVAGAGLSLARQGAEMGDGTREYDIDWGQVALGGLIGAFAAPIMTVIPELGIPLIAYGLYSGAKQASQGHYRTAAVDILSSLLPMATKGGRAAMFGRGSYIGSWRGLGSPRTTASRVSQFWVRSPSAAQTFTSTRTVVGNARRLMLIRTREPLMQEFDRVNTELIDEYQTNLKSARSSSLLGDAREQHVAQLFGGRVVSGKRGMLFELFNENLGKRGGAYEHYTDVDVEVPGKELIFVGGPGKAKLAPHELAKQFFRQADLASYFEHRGRLVLFEGTPKWVVDMGVKYFGEDNVLSSVREPSWFVMDPAAHR